MGEALVGRDPQVPVVGLCRVATWQGNTLASLVTYSLVLEGLLWVASQHGSGFPEG